MGEHSVEVEDRFFTQGRESLFTGNSGLGGTGRVDEIVTIRDLRRHGSLRRRAWQNPKSICPQHQMILPRIIRG